MKTINFLYGFAVVATAATLTGMAIPDARAQGANPSIAGAKAEGKLVSYGMSDDWVNFENIFKAIETKYGVKHTDTDMTSAEEITKLLAERSAPVMDIADIGYDFAGRLLENNLAAAYKNASWNTIPDRFKDKDGRWAASYWGAISFLVNTDKVKNPPQTWNDLLKPEYKDMVCSRDPRVSTYATASVLAAAYANGGGEGNVQPGLNWFKALRDTGNLRKGVVLNVAAVQKGECPISLVYDFDGFAKRDATGLPLKVIIPKDGTVGMLFAQYISAQAPQRQQMGVIPAAANHIAAGRGYHQFAGTGQHRPGQQHGGADAAAQLAIQGGFGKAWGVDAPGVRVEFLHRRTHVANQLAHRLDIPDAREVTQRHRLVREQAGGEEWEGGILVSSRSHGSLQGVTAFDHKLFHQFKG